MPKLFLLVNTLLIALFAMAQPPLPAKQYNFTHYTTASGLISNQVNNIIQDDQGYLWITTTDGLQRFDGVRYKTFRHNPLDPSSIPANMTGQMLLDKKNNLWILLASGKVCIFNTRTFSFKEVNVKTKRDLGIHSVLQYLSEDDKGNKFLLIGGVEVLTYSEKTNEFSYENNFFKQKDDWKICSFMPQPGTQKYWMCVNGGGLAIYNHATGNLSYVGNNVEHEPIIEEYKDLVTSVGVFFDSKNRFWFINWNPSIPVVYCYDLKTNQRVFKSLEFYSSFNAYHELYGFFEQKDGSVWIKGQPVLARYLEDQKKFQLVYNGYINEQGISYSSISWLYEDREKNIWVATDNNGLFRFNPDAEFFTNVKHINRSNKRIGDGNPMSFIATKWGTILCGTWGDGMYEYDKNFNDVPVNIEGVYKKTNPFIWWMVPSKDSNSIWMASQPGIYKLDQRTHGFKFYNPPILEGRTVRQIAEDKYGNLWLGMQSTGVFKWTAAKGQKDFNEGIAKVPGLPAKGQVGRIFIDSKGLVWIGIGVDGVYVIDPETDKVVMHFGANETGAKKLPDGGVSSIGEYDDTTMIITTTTNIFTYNRIANTSAIIGTAENISGFIAAFEKDKNGFLWLATTNGLYRINIQKRIFVYFNRLDGIENEKFSQPDSYVMPDGRMIFGTTTNFVVFDPLAIKLNNSFADITITDFKVFNRSLQIDSLLKLKEVELDYNDNSLTIEFSSLLYNTASLIKYKLSGIDKNWVIAGKDNHAIYNYLPPGTYTFLLKAINENGKESVKMTTLVITIAAPFWRTWWFYSLLALAAVGLLFWLDKQRSKRKEAVQKMRTDIADKLHQDVNTALNNINILSEMAKLKADKDIEKSKEYIQQIHGKSQQMIVAMDDMLWGINPDNDNMQKTIDRFKEHIDGLRNRYAVQIDVLVDEKVASLDLDMQLRQNIFWLLRGGSTNIVRTGAANCHFHIGYRKPNLVYTMEFDSSKTDMLQLNNLLQRKELADKLQEINAALDVKLQQARSVVELSIPVY